jgi:hypothetical protein
MAERQRRPTREYVEQVWDTWQPTRREVLRVALGTATMAALPYTGCMSQNNHAERVAIVGAGLARLPAWQSTCRRRRKIQKLLHALMQ